jgi:fumarate reductase subunit D
MNEPRWKTLLCWGTVLTFLTLPLLIFAMALASREFGWTDFEAHIKEYKFLGSFYQSITGLVFGLAGLRSFDRYVEVKNGDKK